MIILTVKIGINGFGRIGRCILAHIVESGRTDVQVIKINATGPLETSAHLMRYDSVHGRFAGEIKIYDDILPIFRTMIGIITKQQDEIKTLQNKGNYNIHGVVH
mgnify:CR=1 FL=1